MSKINFKISRPILYSLILLAAAAVVVAAIEFGGVYTEYRWKKHIREEAEAKLAGEVNKIQNIILSIQQIPQNLAYVLEFSSPKKDHLRFLLDAVVDNNDEVFGSCIAFEPYSFEKDSMFYAPYLYKKNGTTVYVDPTDSSGFYFSSDWYLIPKKLNKPAWIEPYYDVGFSGGNIIMATYAVPFYSYDGKKESMQGIVTVDISLDWLSKLVSSIKMSETSYTVLLSEAGTVISAPDPQWAYNESIYTLAEEMNLPVLREIGRNLRLGKSGFVNAGNLGGKKDWWIYYMPIPANKWGVLLVVRED
jgi:phosphoserine phosphatase RsbU/P